jgi:hypothetical protein
MATAALLVALLAVVPPATDEDAEPVLHSSIYLESGLGAPLGVIGIESVTRLTPWLELSGGLGLGYAASESEPHPSVGHLLQWSLMPRLLLGNTRGGVTLGVGASGGNYGDMQIFCIDGCNYRDFPVSYFLWSNVEVGGEVWMPIGLAARIFAGYAHGWCASSSCVSAPNDIPYLGVGVGYAF